MGWTLDVAGHAVSLPGVAALGLGVGWVAGMFGVGGGFLLTPLLTIAFGVPLEIAVGTGLCQMVGTAAAALLGHRSQGQGEVRCDLVLLLPSLLGVEVGAMALARLEDAGSVALGGGHIPLARLVAMLGYAVVLLVAAAMFGRGGRGDLEETVHARRGPLARIVLPPAIDLPAVPLRRVSAPLLAYLGLGLGVLSGFLGIGGGVALMPVLVYGLGFPLRQAAGTGILALCATATMGTLVHARRGHVDLELAMVLLVGSTLAAQLGARATRSASPRVLRRGFAGLILITVTAIGWDLARRARGGF
ncbi:MAG: sulfite exporter TauE/SafE family protein [bacterium]|nr:sulfite exporter TauE/SafE family protein [bacterium]